MGWNARGLAIEGLRGERGVPGVGFTWESAYSHGTTYSKNDVVKYNGSTWICLLTNALIAPTTGSGYWDLMVEGLDTTGLTADRLIDFSSGAIASTDLAPYLLVSTGLTINTSSGVSTLAIDTTAVPTFASMFLTDLTVDQLLASSSGAIVNTDLSLFLTVSSGLSISTSSGVSTITTNFVSSDSSVSIVSSSGAINFTTSSSGITTFNCSSGSCDELTSEIIYLTNSSGGCNLQVDVYDLLNISNPFGTLQIGPDDGGEFCIYDLTSTGSDPKHWFNKGLEVHGNICPWVNNSDNLGSSGARWDRGYFNGITLLGDASVPVIDIDGSSYPSVRWKVGGVQKFGWQYFGGGANLYNASDYRIFVKDDGNVGIGTNTVPYKLNINGNLGMDLNSILCCYGIGFGWSGTYGSTLSYNSIGCHPTDTDSIRVNSYNNIYLMLDSNNNNPSSYLYITTYDGTEVLSVCDGGTMAGGKIGGVTSPFYWGNTAADFVTIKPDRILLQDAGSSAKPTTTMSHYGLVASGPNVADASQSIYGPSYVCYQYRSGTQYSLGLHFHKNVLTGNLSVAYPVLRTTFPNLYFDVGGVYVGYLSTTNVGAIDFTAQHRATTDTTIDPENIGDYVGLIVVATGSVCSLIGGAVKTGKGAITVNEAIPVVAISSAAYDKRCFGIVSCGEDLGNDENETERHYKVGALTSVIQKPATDHRIYINSGGEGAIWVCDEGGNIENGDYITTSSSVAGFGMKQDDDILHNYTVAKSTINCTFDLDSTTYNCIEVANIRRAFISCTYHCG
jgi:hypothetical protein